MSLLLSAFLTLAAADDSLPARAAHYGQLAEGLVRSRFVRKGMTRAQVRRVLGLDSAYFLGHSGQMHHFYPELGLVISYAYDGEVAEYEWRPRAFEP
jgi:hypothetical protein